MKILHFITKSEAGGAQTHIADLCGYFYKQDHTLAVMSYPGGWLEKEVEKIGIKFFSNRFFSNFPTPFKVIMAIREIKKQVKAFNPDIIHCHSSSAALLVRLAIRGKIKTIYTAHGWGFNNGIVWWQKYIVILLEKITAKYTDKYICVSDFVKQLALKYKIASEDKMVVIYNGISLLSYRPLSLSSSPILLSSPCKRGSQEKQNSVSEEIPAFAGMTTNKIKVEMPYLVGMTSKKIKIIFVGRLAKPKNPLALIQAYENLDSDIKNKAEIDIIGDGVLMNSLKKYIKENKIFGVNLLGEKKRDEVLKLLSLSDIFVLISDWEGFPYVVLEAMAAGLPVIASDVGGIGEAVNKENGFLIEKDDINSLKESLKKLIIDKELRQRLGSKGSDVIKEKFTPEEMFRRVDDVYKNLKN